MVPLVAVVLSGLVVIGDVLLHEFAMRYIMEIYIKYFIKDSLMSVAQDYVINYRAMDKLRVGALRRLMMWLKFYNPFGISRKGAEAQRRKLLLSFAPLRLCEKP